MYVLPDYQSQPATVLVGRHRTQWGDPRGGTPMSPRRRAAGQTQSPDQPSLPLPEQVGRSDAGGVNAASSRTPRWHRPDDNGVEAAGVWIPDNINPFDNADDPVRAIRTSANADFGA